MTSPAIVHEKESPEVTQLLAPGDAVALYEVTGLPLLDAACQLTVAVVSPGWAVGNLGAPGRPAGVTDTGELVGPAPATLLAVTVIA